MTVTISTFFDTLRLVVVKLTASNYLALANAALM